MPNPDNRKDNVENIARNITMTIENMRRADEMISKTSDENLRNEFLRKNKRRRNALKSMRKEIRQEAIDREQGYPNIME